MKPRIKTFLTYFKSYLTLEKKQKKNCYESVSLRNLLKNSQGFQSDPLEIFLNGQPESILISSISNTFSLSQKIQEALPSKTKVLKQFYGDSQGLKFKNKNGSSISTFYGSESKKKLFIYIYCQNLMKKTQI